MDAGADVNAQDNSGWTALTHAAWGGNTEIVRTLMDVGADVNAQALNNAASGGIPKSLEP